MPIRMSNKCKDCEQEGRTFCHHCPVCSAEDCYTHCYESSDGKHEADPRSAKQADETDLVVDYNCKHCGQNGGVRIDPDDIDWG